jgi:hypothetical protein
VSRRVGVEALENQKGAGLEYASVMGSNGPHAEGEPCCGACGVASEVARTGVPVVTAPGGVLDGSTGVLEVVLSNGVTAELRGKTRFLIGRGRSCDVVLDSNKVSREQCAVELRGGQVELVDQGSGCGTFVNGQRTSRHALRVNDVVFIGDVTLRFAAR